MALIDQADPRLVARTIDSFLFPQGKEIRAPSTLKAWIIMLGARIPNLPEPVAEG
jgi:hypothetical protein